MREFVIAILFLLLILLVLWQTLNKTRDEEAILDKLKAIFGDLF
ncbi:hypothetical protein SAMN04488692_1435 [Halarsenatibacter silvermanii]|uniref:Uncharacterized protein n=1 Tax=Halarsenatibacter silvermanii TaxID=321763 RepID=A0A1G9TNM5_9FIRM|nr:hypothetical protein SAMN04488692_1435 [Halarsenatibacter silvermanii]